MASLKLRQNYVATKGIDFEALKPKVRVEPGEDLPANLKAEQINGLLEIGAIQLVEAEEKEN